MATQTLLTIEKMVTGGYGLARLDGQVILVEGALPEEHVRVELIRGKGVQRARILEIVQASADRLPDDGMPSTLNLTHASYAAQLRYKQGFVQESLERIAKIQHPVHDTRPSPHTWQYRSVVQYALGSQGAGYRDRQSHQVQTLRHDPAAHPSISALLERLEWHRLAGAQELVLRASFSSNEIVAAFIGEGQAAQYGRMAHHLADMGVVGVSWAAPHKRRFGSDLQLLWGDALILERYGRYDLSVSASGFAQVNPLAAGELYLKAAELAGKGRHALDLYGGSGALGLHVSDQFVRVTVLDVARESLKRGEQDAKRLGINNVRYRQGDAAHMPDDADTIIIDPPRAGLSPEVRQNIQNSSAKRLVYIACDPATWARDVGEYVRNGWTLCEVIPWDFYPQTAHVEVLSVLVR